MFLKKHIYFFYVYMHLFSNLNQNEFKMIIILIKANFYFFLFFFHQRIYWEHLWLQNKFLSSFLITCRNMFIEVIFKKCVNV